MCGSELARDANCPKRGYSSLRLGRVSASQATYFVTFCTSARRKSLADSRIVSALHRECRAMLSDGTWTVRAWVVMPDHVHIVFDLGERLSLGRCVGRFKAKTSSQLRSANLSWQPGYFEHRLRSAEELRPIYYYLLMNPVRAGIAARGEEWPGFFCCEEDWAWFRPYAQEAISEPVWLAASDKSRASSLPQPRCD